MLSQDSRRYGHAPPGAAVAGIHRHVTNGSDGRRSVNFDRPPAGIRDRYANDLDRRTARLDDLAPRSCEAGVDELCNYIAIEPVAEREQILGYAARNAGKKRQREALFRSEEVTCARQGAPVRPSSNITPKRRRIDDKHAPVFQRLSRDGPVFYSRWVNVHAARFQFTNFFVERVDKPTDNKNLAVLCHRD